MNFKLGKYVFNLNIKKQDPIVIGINSLYMDGHVPILDYDDKLDLTELIAEIKILQAKFQLGKAIIYGTSIPKNNKPKLSVVFTEDIISASEYFELLTKSSCDKHFKCFYMLRGYTTIRLTPKNKNSTMWIVGYVPSNFKHTDSGISNIINHIICQYNKDLYSFDKTKSSAVDLIFRGYSHEKNKTKNVYA